MENEDNGPIGPEKEKMDGDKEKRKRINSMVIVVVLATILSSVYFAASISSGGNLIGTQSAQPSSYQSVEFSRAPEFSSVDVVTGETVSLSQFEGKKIILNFVNYGCNEKTNQIVSEQLMVIKDLKGERGDFTTVSVFCGCCPIDSLRDFAIQNELKWSWVLDSDNSIVTDYQDYIKQFGYPTIVYIDQDQSIVGFSGYSEASELSDILDGM